MANLFKQVAFAAATVGLTVATGGAFTGLAAGGAGFFGGIANAFVNLGLKGFATKVATQFILGAALQALARASAKDQIAGTLVSGRDPIASRKVIYGTRRVGGTQVFLGTEGSENRFLYMVIALAGHEVHRIREVYFGEDRVYYWDGSNHVKDTTAPQYDAGDQELYNITFFDGSDSQTADSELVTKFPEWTNDHRLQGVAYIKVQLKYNPDKFSGGIPNITALVDGKEVYDSVNDVTGHSDNAAMCILDYLRDDEYGLGVSDDEIDFDSFNEAIVLCNEQVTLDAGGTEDRYTINGVVDTSASPKQVIEEMLLSMGGKLVYAAGKFKLIGAEYRTPTVTLDEDDIISDITVITKNSARDFYNGVRGVFSNPADLYQPTEYPVVESSTYQNIDGITRYTQLDLPYTTSSATAQRLAKVLLNQSRQEVTIQMRCKLTALNITVGDNIYVNNTRLGFTNKVFEVGSVAISPQADGSLGVDIMAREINESTYDWTATDEQALIANAAPYANNFAVPAPTNLSVTSSASINEDGTAVTTWSASWTDSEARNFATYEVQWKTAVETNYHSTYTKETSISGVGDVVPGQSYTFRVRTISSNGAASQFDTATHVMAGDTAAPSAPTGLSAVGRQGAVLLDWTGNTEDDLKGYYVYQNTANQFSNAIEIAFVNADQFFRANLDDNQTYYFWVKAIDFTGNESSQSSSAVATTLPEPTDGTSVLVVYADDAGGSNQSLTVGNRQFVQYVEYVGTQPSLPVSGTFVQFAGTSGDPGQSIFPIYATSSGGANQSFSSTGRDFVTFFEATSQPSLPVSGQTFVKFVGEDGVDGQDGADGQDGSDGDTGPRNATGYVFYQIQQSSSPSTPSASNFNFSTGTFTGLSSNWDESVSTQTPIEGRNYWASRYSVSENFFGGTKSISFTSPFVWQNFDGLVTFTNIEDGIDQNVTTIDGGNVDLVNLNASNITTGTLSSNIVYTGFLELDDSVVGAGKTFVDPQWGTLTAAFALDSSNNSNGLYSEWTSNGLGSAIYGRADGFNEGAAVAGVNYSNSTSSQGSYGGFFDHDSTSNYSFGAIGVTSSTSNTSGGLVGQSPFGGIALRVNQGRVLLGAADATEGAEIELSSPSGVGWINDVTSTSVWRVFYNTSPFNQAFLDQSGNFTISGSYSPFTGSHLALVEPTTNVEIGDIAADTDVIYKEGISQTLTVVESASIQKSKRAIGVFAALPDQIKKYKPSEEVETQTLSGQTVTYHSKVERDDRLSHFDKDLVDSFADQDMKITYINAVGEGQINVCGQNGDIEAGDLIVTSDMAGKGMKQDDDLVRGYTVAKARESVTFANPSEIKQIACIYLCG